MAWRMPAETAPHDRTWMAFPREGPTLGDTAAEAEECYAAWTAVAHAVAEFEPLTMVVDPVRAVDRARRMLGSEIELIEAPLDEFWMRDFGPTFVLDDERPGVLGAVDWTFNGWGDPAWSEWRKSAEIARVVERARRVGAGQLGARERGRRHPCRRRRHGAADRDGAARPPPQPVRRQGARRGRTRPHDRLDHRDLAAARPHARLRRIRHERPRRHRRDDALARAAAAARAARPGPSRSRRHPRAARAARRADRRRRPPVRHRRSARPRDAPRPRGLRGLELRQPPRRQRRRDRVRLR